MFIESSRFIYGAENIFLCVAVELQNKIKDEYPYPQWVSNQRTSQATADPPTHYTTTGIESPHIYCM